MQPYCSTFGEAVPTMMKLAVVFVLELLPVRRELPFK
jgi:hypothetical protein